MTNSTVGTKTNSIPTITIPDKETTEITTGINNKDSIDSKTPSSSPLSMKHYDSPKTSVEEKEDQPHNEKNESTNQQQQQQQESTDIIDEHVISKSPILESAYRVRSQKKPENGKFTKQNRPISMSFKGLNAPSFTGKLKKKY